jgi:predicted dehydrogenase
MPILKGGMIGLRGHAERLLRIFEAKEELVMHKKYLPRYDENPKVTQKLVDLLGLDFIVISSPTLIHSEQLKKLSEYKGHIFCEKPIALDSEILGELKETLFKGRFYTNYCFNCSPVGKQMTKFLKENFEQILDLHINFSHGVAWRIESNNWRFHPMGGVLNTVVSHFYTTCLR